MTTPSHIRAATLGVLAVFISAGALSGCDSGPSPLPARDHSKAAMDQAARDMASRPAERAGASTQQALADVPLVEGKPMWAPNRKHTAQENAAYQFQKNGADFGAGSVSAYVGKAHAFIDAPPKGAQTIKRSNGDRLIYDAKANVFAVASKDGAPRTMFKPQDGAAYWAKQKDRESGGGRSRRGNDA